MSLKKLQPRRATVPIEEMTLHEQEQDQGHTHQYRQKISYTQIVLRTDDAVYLV